MKKEKKYGLPNQIIGRKWKYYISSENIYDKTHKKEEKTMVNVKKYIIILGKAFRECEIKKCKRVERKKRESGTW